MAKQDETAPDSQDQEIVRTLVPFDDFLDKIIRQSSTGEGNKLRVEFNKFFKKPIDAYKSYEEAVDRDLEDLDKDYIKYIFSVNSEALNLDQKYRITLLEKIKNSRTT
jgi:hypothetical protein